MIRMMMTLACLAFAAASAAAAPALGAPCRAELDFGASAVRWPGDTGAGYIPFAPNAQVEPVAFAVLHRGEACRLAVAFEGPAARGGFEAAGTGEPLTLRLTDAAAGGMSLAARSAAPTGGSALMVHAPQRAETASLPLQVYLSAPAGQVPAPGVRTVQVQAVLFADTATGWRELDRAPLTFGADVAATARLAADESGAERGALAVRIGKGGGDAVTRLYARSNTPAALSVETRNGFSLVHENGHAALPYRVEINGAPIRRGASLPVAATGEARAVLPVRVTVPPHPDTPPAGVYEDVVRFTLTADPLPG